MHGTRRPLVVVREQLEDRELRNYRRVSDRFDVGVVTTRISGPYAATGLGFPVRRLARRVDPPGPALLGRGVRRLLRSRVELDALVRFGGAIPPGAIVCVNESHMVSSWQAAELRRRRTDLRVVVVVYENIPFRYEDDPLLARRKDVVRETADLFVALTEPAAEALALEGVDRDRIVVQPYGVDTDVFSPAHRNPEVRRRWGAAPDEVVVLFTGRLLQEKGLVPLVMAAACASTPVRLVLVGAGPEAGRIQRVVHRLGLGGRVVTAPWAPPTEVATLVASADVFALPSLPTPYWEEQLGFSMIEAMACGVPVLATASGSIPFVLGDGGITVPPYDPQALADALDAVAADATGRRAMGDRGRRRAAAHFDADGVGERLADLLEGL